MAWLILPNSLNRMKSNFIIVYLCQYYKYIVLLFWIKYQLKIANIIQYIKQANKMLNFDSSMPVLKFATKKLIDLKMPKQNDERTKKSKDHLSIALKLKPDNLNSRDQKTKCKNKSISIASTRAQAITNFNSLEIEPYLTEIMKHLLNRSSANTATPKHIPSHPQIQYQSGKLIIIHAAMMLKQETLHLALTYFSDYLRKSCSQYELGLVAITCLWIASKYEEIYPPRLKYFANFANQSLENIVSMQGKILERLNFSLVRSTSYSYLELLCNIKSDEFIMSNYLLHCCFSRLLAQNQNSIDPALMALSVFKLATHILKKSHVKSQLEKLASYSKEDFTDCFKKVCTSIASQTSKSKIMKKKFGEGNVLKVSNFCTFMK